MKPFLSFSLITIVLICIFSCSTTQTATTNQQHDPHSVVVNNIKFKFIELEVDQKFLKINVLITSVSKDLTIVINDDTTPIIFDNKGNQYKCKYLKIGQKQKKYDSWWGNSIITELFQDVPLKMEMTFENIPEEITSIPLLQFKFIHLLDEKGHSSVTRKEFTVKLNSIPIEKKSLSNLKEYKLEDISEDPKFNVNNMSFRISEIKKDENKLNISILITNHTNDKIIVIQEEKSPVIFDPKGNQYKCFNFTIGQNKKSFDAYWGNSVFAEIFQNTPIKLEMTYENIPDNIDYLTLLQFKFTHLLDGRGVDSEQRREYSVKINSIKL